MEVLFIDSLSRMKKNGLLLIHKMDIFKNHKPDVNGYGLAADCFFVFFLESKITFLLSLGSAVVYRYATVTGAQP